MRDRRLDQNITRVEGFIEEWKRVSQYIERGFGGAQFTDEEEAGFLELKSTIAQDYELLMTTLGTDAERTDRALRLLHAMPSLQAIRESEDGANRRLTSEWHSTYLSLQSLLGRLKGRRLQLASTSSLRLGLRTVFANPLVLLVVALFAAYGVYKLAEQYVPKVIELGE